MDIITLALNLQTTVHCPDSALLTDKTFQVGKFLGRAARKPLEIESGPAVLDRDLLAIQGHRTSPQASVQAFAL